MISLNPRTYKQLYAIDRTIRTAMRVCTIIWLVMMIAAAFPTSYKQWFVYGFIVFFVLFLLLAVARMCLSPFVKSDEEEEFEEKVDYVLKNRHAAELQQVIEDYSPLCNLTNEQNERVKRLLRELPSHPDKPDHINLSSVAQYLTALEQTGIARLDDKRNLRSWVAQVTGKKVPSPSQFNEAIPSTNKKKVADARKVIENRIH